MTKPCSKHGYAIQICCLYVADGRQRSVYALSGKSIRTSLKWSMNKKTRESLNNKPCILVKHAIQAFFQNTGLIFTQICLFSLISCFLFCKPDLKQVHPQHFFDTYRRTSPFSLGIIRFNYVYPFIPWNNFIHDLKKFFSSCLLFTTAVLNVSKRSLLHFFSPPLFVGFIIPYSSRSFITSIKSEVPQFYP